MGVAGRRKLGRALGGGVERHRIVDPVGQREGQVLAGAVDRGRAGVDQVLEVRQPAAGLHHDHLAHHVGRDVGVGVDQRVAHAGLRGQVDHPRDVRIGLEQSRHRLAVRHVGPVEGEAAIGREPVDPSLLQDWIVVVIEAIHTDHPLTPFQERFADVVTNEACTAGDENGHRGWTFGFAGAEDISGAARHPKTAHRPTAHRRSAGRRPGTRS